MLSPVPISFQIRMGTGERCERIKQIRRKENRGNNRRIEKNKNEEKKITEKIEEQKRRTE